MEEDPISFFDLRINYRCSRACINLLGNVGYLLNSHGCRLLIQDIITRAHLTDQVIETKMFITLIFDSPFDVIQDSC